MTPGSPLPLRLRLSIRAEGQSRRFEISARPRTTTKLTVNLNSIPALRREKRDRGRGGRRGRLFDTAGPATAARYHGVASIPHPLSGVSIRKRPMVSARNVSRTLHASFSRQARFNRKKFGIYRGHA